MNKRLLLVASLVLLVSGTCGIELVQGTTSSTVSRQGKKPVNPDVQLQVTFRDLLTDRVTSDTGGSYVHGFQNVSAVIASNGNLQMDTNTSGGLALRSLKVDFSSPTPDNASPISPSLYQPDDGATIVTRAIGIPIQSMVVGTYQCVELAFGFREGSTQYTLAYHGKSYPADDISGTSYALVTRTSIDTWEIEPIAPCLDVPTVGKLNTSTTRGKAVWTSYGKYYMPFKLSLMRLVSS